MSKISVKIPMDTKQYNAKIYFGFTKRQFLCFCAVVVLGLPTYLLNFKTNAEFAKIALVLIGMSCFVFLIKVNDQPLEVFLKAWLWRHLTPMSRPYQIENSYDFLVKEDDKYEQLQKKAAPSSKAIDGRTKKQRKKLKESPQYGTENAAVQNDSSGRRLRNRKRVFFKNN